MITKNIYNYLGAAALTAVTVACTTQAANDPEVSQPAIQKLPVDAKVVKATPIDQEETVAGSILPNREVAIASELSRKVISIHFKDGTFVQRGQLLYKLDDADILARIKQVQADLGLAKLNEERLATLLKTETVKQEEYDAAYSRLQALQATLELLHVELSKTSLRAPFSGKTGITQVHEGALVTPGMTLVSLQEQGTVKIEFAASEKYAATLRPGRKISFTTFFSAERLTATITATEAGVDANTRSITVYATYVNNGILKPGMSVKIFFPIQHEDTSGFFIPSQALMASDNGYSVYTIKNGAARMTPVKIGNRSESEALITSGLVEGDTVLISNILRTGEGTPVQAVTIQ
jgi:membrane fusion protein, multidrug efflux system